MTIQIVTLVALPRTQQDLWLRSPNPDLGRETPLDLVAANDTQRVIDLLLDPVIMALLISPPATASTRPCISSMVESYLAR